nr:MAG TPA: hypothetical protein [Caudoviricetes sp.]
MFGIIFPPCQLTGSKESSTLVPSSLVGVVD